MKKIFIVLLAACLFSIVSCSSDKKNEDGDGDNGALDQSTLVFEKTLDDRYYTVTGIGTCATENLVIPATYNGIAVEGVSADAFSGNTSIKTLVIEDGVKKIGSSAFSGCSSLVSVEIAASIKKIGASAFNGCSSLKTLTFGSGITNLGENAFLGCEIESLFYEGEIKDFSSIAGVAESKLHYGVRYFYSEECPSAAGYFWYRSENGEPCVWSDYIGSAGIKFGISEDGSYYKVVGMTDSTEKNVIIPRAHKGLPVREIDSMAFISSYMISLKIPDTVTKIASSAFKMCTKLASVSIDGNIEEIGASAFSGCTSLEALVLPKSIKSIGENAFSPSMKIYYASSEENFAEVNVNSSDGWISGVRFYSDFEPVADGAYWHYDSNGKAVEW